MDERALGERYRTRARRSGELFTEASRYIPGGAGSGANGSGTPLSRAEMADAARRGPRQGLGRLRLRAGPVI